VNDPFPLDALPKVHGPGALELKPIELLDDVVRDDVVVEVIASPIVDVDMPPKPTVMPLLEPMPPLPALPPPALAPPALPPPALAPPALPPTLLVLSPVPLLVPFAIPAELVSLPAVAPVDPFATPLFVEDPLPLGELVLDALPVWLMSWPSSVVKS